MGDPTLASLGLVQRLKSTDITGLFTGDPVTTWPTGVAGGANATQATSAAKPLFITGAINSRPTVRFDGVDDMLVMPYTQAGHEISVYLVVKRPGLTANGRFVSLNDNTGFDYDAPGELLLFNDATNALVSLYRNNATRTPNSVALGTTAYASLTQTWEDVTAGGVLYVNGTSVQTVTVAGYAPSTGANSFTFTQLVLAAFAPNYLQVDIAEILVYSKVHTAAERASVHSYIQDTYAITTSDYVAPAAGPTAGDLIIDRS